MRAGLRWRAPIALFTAAASLAVPALAQQPAAAPATVAATGEGPAWSTLSPLQQWALRPLQGDWPGIDAAGKQKWLEIAARFPSMRPAERELVQERMTEWSRLSPEQRGRTRLQFQEARRIPPEERQARWDAYLALPPEERAALAKKSRAVPPAPNPAAAAVLPNQKVNVVNAPSKPANPKPVAPTMVQAQPGATTTLISKTPAPPPHETAGEPKIALPPERVNRTTLLPQPTPPEPRRGSSTAPAATRAPAAPAAPPLTDPGAAPAAPGTAAEPGR